MVLHIVISSKTSFFLYSSACTFEDEPFSWFSWYFLYICGCISHCLILSFLYLSTIKLKKILFIPNPCKSEKYLFTVENIFLTRKTENFKNKIPLLASACVFLAHKEKESKVHIPLISYFVSYAKWAMGLKVFWSHI
jgi:hypothetical protein